MECQKHAEWSRILNKSNFLNGENGVGKALCHAKLKVSHENSRILVKSKSMALNAFAENDPKDSWLLLLTMVDKTIKVIGRSMGGLTE